MSSSDDSTCVITINLEVEIEMCHSLSFWILFPVKIIHNHARTSCMHFELIIEQVSVLIQYPAYMHHFMPAAGTSLCMHENACKSANLHGCIMHASCMQHPCCACSAGMHSLEGIHKAAVSQSFFFDLSCMFFDSTITTFWKYRYW